MKESKTFIIEMDSGDNYEVDVDLYYYREDNWGSDRDGNRGVSMAFLDDYDYAIPTTLPTTDINEFNDKLTRLIENL